MLHLVSHQLRIDFSLKNAELGCKPSEGNNVFMLAKRNATLGG